MPTGTSGGDSQKLLSWRFQVCSHRVLLLSCGGDCAEDWPLERWGKLVHEGEPLARSCMWLDVLWAGFWAAWKVLDRGWMTPVPLENKPHGRKWLPKTHIFILK